MASPRAMRIAMGISSAALFCYVAWQAQLFIRADLMSEGARKLTVAWAAERTAPTSPEQWANAKRTIEAATALVSDDAALLEMQGDVEMAGGATPWPDDEERRGMVDAAVDAYRKAVALRPTEARTWASLASAYFAGGVITGPMQEAWSRALAAGPYEGNVQPALMDLALGSWGDASEEMRGWATQVFEEASPNTRERINRLAQARGWEMRVDDGSEN